MVLREKIDIVLINFEHPITMIFKIMVIGCRT